jgi:hypothetical protein
MSAFRTYICHLECLPKDWGGSEKPTQQSLDTTLVLIEAISHRGILPHRVAPIADGGVCVRYIKQRRQARLDIYNSGGIVLVKQDPDEEEPSHISEVQLHEAAAALADFLLEGLDED